MFRNFRHEGIQDITRLSSVLGTSTWRIRKRQIHVGMVLSDVKRISSVALFFLRLVFLGSEISGEEDMVRTDGRILHGVRRRPLDIFLRCDLFLVQQLFSPCRVQPVQRLSFEVVFGLGRFFPGQMPSVFAHFRSVRFETQRNVDKMDIFPYRFQRPGFAALVFEQRYENVRG